MQNDAAPDREQRGQEYGEPSGVIHGRVNLNPITRPQLPGDHRVVGVPCDLPMGNHYALRLPGGAAGIEQAINILGLESRRQRIGTNPIDRLGISQYLRGVFLRIQIDQVLEGHELLELFRKLLVSRGVHQAARRAVRQYLVQFAGCAARPERDEDNAGFTGGAEGFDIFNPVFRKDADAISWNKRAEIGPDPRALQGPPIEFRISELPARGNVDQCYGVGAKTGAFSENVGSDHECSPDCLETDCAVKDARVESDARICSKACVNSWGRSN